MTLDPRGPMRPGQPLALSAAQLNWINQQMRGPGMGGGALGVARGLPQMTVAMPVKGYFGQVAYHPSTAGTGTLATPGSPPAAPSTRWNYSADEQAMRAIAERQVFSFGVTSTIISGSGGGYASGGDPPLLICTDNDSHNWVVSGYAVCRVRVFSREHRHARMARTFPGSTSEQNAAAAGCLDSAFYGPARILAYYITEGAWTQYPAGEPFAYPAHEFRWALVKI